MASSPVVASVVAALAAAMTTLLGFTAKPAEGRVAALGDGAAWRLGAFEVECALALLTGIYIRANDVLSPSPKQKMSRLEHAGLLPAEARRWVLARHLGSAGAAGEAPSG